MRRRGGMARKRKKKWSFPDSVKTRRLKTTFIIVVKLKEKIGN